MSKFKCLVVALVLALAPSFGYAQSAVKTYPLQVTSTNSSSTVTVTDTFQSIWTAVPIQSGSQGRSGCTVQNTGTHSMYVYFGAIASATKDTAVVLSAGQAVNCTVGGITLQDQVSITGTMGDTFYAAQQ